MFGGSSKNASSKPIDLQSPELAALRAPFAQQLTSLMQQGGRPAYSGPLVAGITPEALQSAVREVLSASRRQARTLP